MSARNVKRIIGARDKSLVAGKRPGEFELAFLAGELS
jgi:hypothetical protein